jgi:hypothetical protein
LVGFDKLLSFQISLMEIDMCLWRETSALESNRLLLPQFFIALNTLNLRTEISQAAIYRSEYRCTALTFMCCNKEANFMVKDKL